MLFLCYPKCSTCQKAKAWLEERSISYDLRDIKQDNPTVEELTAWYSEKRSAPEKVFQHQRTAIQGPRSEGQTDRHE